MDEDSNERYTSIFDAHLAMAGIMYEVLAMIKGAPTATEMIKVDLVDFDLVPFRRGFQTWSDFDLNSLSSNTKLTLSSL